ncbi:conserved hypothetical protein [Luminiphilus syltensis NOR5-1B]|uniref:Outer membrane protein beta-barrel domain-containing protein n=1 Tax=Luminiphilus syltensis NOR5-1B TaxID=565045 RepID=B8KVH0_9GAMM|nr:outer membrane beta-barrel protein [Luminiphilus syltensis]EED36219.1 conserved hypothetical protein [Luminiphilus syltensis NOR5-1B]
MNKRSCSLTTRLRLLIGALLLMSTATAPAAEISILGGMQLNSDFIVSDDVTTDPPPQAPGQPGTDISVDNGPSFAVALDFDLPSDPTGKIGLYLSQQSTDIGTGAGLNESGITATQLHFTGTRVYPMGGWEAFASAGLGGTLLDPDDSSLKSSTEFSFNIAGGTQYTINDAFRLRFEARWIPILTGTGVAGICSGGCIIRIDSSLYSQFQLNAGFSLRF